MPVPKRGLRCGPHLAPGALAPGAEAQLWETAKLEVWEMGMGQD